MIEILFFASLWAVCASHFIGNIIIYYFDEKPEDTLNIKVSIKHTVNAKDLMSYCKKYPINNLPKVTNLPEPPQFPNVPSKDRAKHR